MGPVLGPGIGFVAAFCLGLGFYPGLGHPLHHGFVISLVLGFFLGPDLAAAFGCGLGFGFVFVCAAGLGLGPGLSLGLGVGLCCCSILELGHGPVFLGCVVGVSCSSSVSLDRPLLCSVSPLL